MSFAKLGIGIPALVRYRSIPVQDWAPYFDTRLVPASEFMFIPVPDWLDAGQSDIPAFKKKLLVVVVIGYHYPVHIQTEDSGKWYTLHAQRQLLRVLFLLYDIEKSYVNAGMPEKS